MRYNRVYLETIGYELGPVVVSSEELEARLQPAYEILHLQPGQLESLTGVVERRWWKPNTPVSEGAVLAAQKATNSSAISVDDIEVLIYAGVCRENFEPATACRVAHELGVRPETTVYDLSNACLGVLNGMLEIANRIELGQIRAGMVLSCETAREINESMIEKILAVQQMDFFASSLATLTGGSGAVAVLLSDGSFDGSTKHKIIGGTARTAPEFHNLCRWGVESDGNGRLSPIMSTNSVELLKNGITLFKRTWADFLKEMDWTSSSVDKIICHQIGIEHQKQIIQALQVPEEKDLSTFEYLGNIGTVSLPITAAISHERDLIKKGERIGFLGVGSGLNSLMLGLEW